MEGKDYDGYWVEPTPENILSGESMLRMKKVNRNAMPYIGRCTRVSHGHDGVYVSVDGMRKTIEMVDAVHNDHMEGKTS